MSKIVNFSEAASIGIHALIILARTEKPMNAIRLSEEIGSSKHHIGKVLQRLVKDGLLVSSRGPSGGFALKKNPTDIKIYDIYSSIEGEIENEGCPDDFQVCPVDKCFRNNIIKKLTQDFVTYLDKYSLADFV